MTEKVEIREKKKRKCTHYCQKFTYGIVTYTEWFFYESENAKIYILISDYIVFCNTVTPQDDAIVVILLIVWFISRYFVLTYHLPGEYYQLGIYVGKYPFKTIGICWAIVICSSLGFLRFRQEKNPLKLWVPPDTSFIRDSEWLMKSLQIAYQEEAVMLTGDDVLTPEIIQKIYNLDQKLRYSKTSTNLTFKDVCFLIPKLDKSLLKFLDVDDPRADPSLQMNPALYCSFVESMKKECYTKSILDLWDYDKEKIMNLTKEDIIEAINSNSENIFGHLKSFEDLLGLVKRNDSGHIIGAKAIYNYWYLTKNFSAIDVDKTGNYAGTGDWATEEAIAWEGLFLEILEEFGHLQESVYYAGRSFGDISNAVLFNDMDKIAFGVMLMIVYIQLVISKYNWVEARIVLGFVGLLSIGMSFIVGAGLCSLFGIPYGPVHTSLPFLLMGLGVDDMFVIMACWEELTVEEKRLPIHEKIGLMLKHAGVSITITSCTDVIAFLIGSSTILPCLESFCLYAAVGVLMTFIFAVTFFVACFVIDQKRIEQNRNGTFPWIVHRDFKPNSCSQKNITNVMFNKVYSNVILTVPGKVTVIAISIICAGFGIESALKLEQHFDPTWFVPEDTHLGKFFAVREVHYPGNGFDAGMYLGPLNYSYELTNIKHAVDQLESYSNITENIVSWVDPFREFVLYNFHHDVYEEPLDDLRFKTFLSKFLMSPRFARYQANFIFENELECGAPAPEIKMATIDFHFKRFKDPRRQIPAMHKVRDVAEKANFTTGNKFATVWSKFFSTWITDELIDVEVMRNLQLALLCVMLCTILLIANWQICAMIFFCVLITMVDVCGFMQRWGLTIDLVSCIGLELAIGLCVDYATHVGHTFLTVGEGNKQDRVVKTVTSIGSAVLYGGLSTFIGMFMMSQSKAYTFQSFFKIFCLVILFGLFHGIVLLPVVLSLIGPNPYPTHKKPQQNEAELKPLDS